METGWTNGPREAPAMPLANLLMDGRGERAAGVLETSLARARAQEARELREQAAAAPDPDERAANLIARGILPGQVSGLNQRLGDTLAELAGEREKIERAGRRQERVRRDHQAGRISMFDIARMDFDEGDAGKVARLERRAASLQRQIREAAALMAPEQVPEDPLQAAASRANAVFREVTRAKMEAAQAGRSEPRPFASRAGLSAADAECTGPSCPVCAWGRAREAERCGGDPNGYPPGAVIATGYAEVYR